MNLQIFFIGLFFGIAEIWYFGWNLTPQSDAEMICDGIALLILALAFIVPKRAT
ncbi:hypothetical protein [Shewanella algae]|uniref:hypothetical protein n=1 Tax=Shewanella algae TaxID=38313 RepID=UPI0016424EFB|nr:hypothetical protein [Shewanella algae]